ncbi:putative bifunctional diguanylate cyclase/phosphodiesterase [Micromonospora craniellae]|uniref:EAL domain-containing protein n=1 Tax=Micromonospora craniellae TaxID=2294034 RepID=A0A372FVJ3_9ACTN|nr:EAL domain-containing protein [Micromonospora craniellae]QOC93161.1 EAL domain-containing protein [Micromonospora craniellae]RFS44812.1 EAL domain-containing protein [Micromonospora craniellae]
MEPPDPRNLVPPGRTAPFSVFVGGVLAVAVLLSVGPLVSLAGTLSELPAAFWTMAVLAVACDARPFLPPGRRPSSSAVFPSTCFTFAILLGWGLGPAVAVQAVAVLVSGARMRHAPWRVAFNAGQYACSLAAAYAVTRLGPGGIFDGGGLGWTDIAAIGGAGVAWFLVNYGLVTTAVRLRFGERWWPNARHGLPFELLSTGSLLLLAPVLVTAARASAALVPLVLVPLFAVYRMARLTVEQRQLAALDPLTGLPNRKALLSEVNEQVHRHAERAARGEPGAHLALLLIDLDRFKNVNDALGHAVGDRLLVEVSARLTDLVPAPDMVVRLGGDEFAIVMTGVDDVTEARALADQVVRVLAEPVPLDGLPLEVGGSIGIALYPEHGEDFATLMRHADVAMYDAKHRNGTVAVYTAESDHNSAERLGLLADLRRVLDAGPAGRSAGAPGDAPVVRGGDGAALTATPAVPQRGGWFRRRRRPPAIAPDDELIARIVAGADPILRRTVQPGDPAAVPGEPWSGPAGAHRPGDEVVPSTGAAFGGDPSGDAGEIMMYYQPQIAIATGEVVGVEALLRWRHPRRGMVDPEELIRVAEQSAVMRLLTRRVVDDVVEQLAKWSAAGLGLRAALNVSVRDLHTGEIADQIADRLTRYGVVPERLQLEITEGALMADPRRVLTTITRLHRIGVGIALDDFGTGYSSLQHLRRLPLSEVKVDRSFVLGMTEDSDDAAIVRSTIGLAKALGLRVVAEGVEDEKTWRMLHAAGCDAAQGWFYARPMPAEELVAWLARYRPLRPLGGHDEPDVPRRSPR